MSRTLEEYMQLPYRVILTHDQDEEGNEGWVAEVAELPGCLSQGETPEAAAASIRDAMEGWLSVALEDGRPIPEPGQEGYSGKFVIRLPSSLHGDVARAAEGEGVSLNQFVAGVLASAVSWRSPRSVVVAKTGGAKAKARGGAKKATRQQVRKGSSKRSGSSSNRHTRSGSSRRVGGKRAGKS